MMDKGPVLVPVQRSGTSLGILCVRLSTSELRFKLLAAAHYPVSHGSLVNASALVVGSLSPAAKVSGAWEPQMLGGSQALFASPKSV